MPRLRIAVALLTGALALAACTPEEAPSVAESPTAAPLESPNAQAVVETLDAFRDAVPELADLPFESIEGLTVQRNDRQWVLGASNDIDEASMLRAAVMSEFGEFPEVDLATVSGGTVYQTAIAPDGRPMTLTLNDLDGDAFLFYVLVYEDESMSR